MNRKKTFKKVKPGAPFLEEDHEPLGKLNGFVLAQYDGLTISVSPRPARHAGRNRLWIQIRQEKPKKWRQSVCLAYTRALDVQFVEDQEEK